MIFLNQNNESTFLVYHPNLLSNTFFSSFVGGFFRMHISGAYMNVRMAIPNSIHSKPIVLTSVPLIAGPVNRNT